MKSPLSVLSLCWRCYIRNNIHTAYNISDISKYFASSLVRLSLYLYIDCLYFINKTKTSLFVTQNTFGTEFGHSETVCDTSVTPSVTPPFNSPLHSAISNFKERKNKKNRPHTLWTCGEPLTFPFPSVWLVMHLKRLSAAIMLCTPHMKSKCCSLPCRTATRVRQPA